MLYYVYFSDGGVPKTGLTPTWEYLVTAENGTDKSGSGPAISEVGGGWYNFEITFGAASWDVATEDLLGVIDGGAALADGDRYKPVAITLRGLALAALVHRGEYDKVSGKLKVYGTNGMSGELELAMSESSAAQIREPQAGG